MTTYNRDLVSATVQVVSAYLGTPIPEHRITSFVSKTQHIRISDAVNWMLGSAHVDDMDVEMLTHRVRRLVQDPRA